MKTKGEMVMDMFAAAASSMITMNVIDFFSSMFTHSF